MAKKFDLFTYINDKCEFNINETLLLLRASGFIFMSWGAHAFTNCSNKALRFKVNGHFHKGHIYIFLNGMDLYNVVLTTTKGTIVDEYNDIYADQLVELIDTRIEKISAYSR